MKDEDKAVEEILDPAAVQEEGVKTEDQNAPLDPEIQKLLDDKDEELKKVRTERDNYQKGLLLQKGKLGKGSVEDDDIEDDGKLTPEKIRELTRSVVREEFLSAEELRIQKEKDDLIKKIIKENNELKLANRTKNNLQKAPAAGGGNLDKPKGDPQFWSEEQLAFMKKKGINPDLARENYLKLKNA